jgi:transcriptional regulator with GAF, ATPase, and Fis domain
MDKIALVDIDSGATMNFAQAESQPNVSQPATLLVIRGPNIGVRYQLGEWTRIGRDTANEISLADPNVSRVHAEIVRERFAYVVRDCDSRNGVYVNGVAVREKQLLRNDEIQIGNTVFLFNPELRIENAIFSNSSVVFYPGDAATEALIVGTAPIEISSDRDRYLLDFLTGLAEVFSNTSQRLDEVGRRLLEHLMALFEADRAVLLLRDRRTEKLRTVLALPEGSDTAVNRTSVMRAFEEKRPLLASERPESLARIPLAGHSETAGDQIAPTGRGLSLMCAPILAGDFCLGVLVVEKEGMDRYSLKDLALLQAIAKLAAGPVRGAELADSIELQRTEAGQALWQVVPSRNSAVKALFEQARRVASTDVVVLITGESGTGKEVLARLIHEASPRRQGPFVALNCGAIPATLFESELFGYERGAFTGAVRTTRGKIEAAHGGTLLLDEIGNLDLALQPKLLRFLQERAFYRVGGSRPIEADVRIIAATNEDLEAAVKQGRFRQDLWYRLNVVSFHMPPLRDRREDIAVLAEHFLRLAGARSRKNILGLDDGAIRLLERYDWPGNIRELENAIERAAILASGPVLTAEDFRFLAGREAQTRVAAEPGTGAPLRALAEVERECIVRALEQFDWNQARAAEALGVHRNTLRNKIIEYGLQRPERHQH